MAEKDYKALYEKSLVTRRQQKERIARLQDTVARLEVERLSCDTEPLKGELFGGEWEIVRIEGQLYVKAPLWTVDNGYSGHLVGTPAPKKVFEVFLRRDNVRKPISYWFWTMSGLHFVITRGNYARFILNPPKGQPKHLLLDGDVFAWEGWAESATNELQLEHDQYYLEKLAESASHFVHVGDDDDTDDGYDADDADADESEFQDD